MPGEPIGPSCVISCTSTTLPIRRRMWRRSSTGICAAAGVPASASRPGAAGHRRVAANLAAANGRRGRSADGQRPGRGAGQARPSACSITSPWAASAICISTATTWPAKRSPRFGAMSATTSPRRASGLSAIRLWTSAVPGRSAAGCRGGHRPAHARGTRRHGGRRAVARPGRSDPSARPMGIIFEVGGAHPAVDLQSPFSLPAFARTPNFHAVKNSAISV